MTKLIWVLVFALLLALSIPWFLWGEGGVWLGLPSWVWWHVAWMGVAAVAFGLFARFGWDHFIEEDADG